MPGTPTQAAPPSIPVIGGYELTRKIGAGGIAEIYEGRQHSLNRLVAVKVLSARLLDDSDIRQRFEREALIIARLTHPNIIHVIDRGEEGGRYYIVMEYIEGEDLKTLVRSRSLSIQEKCDIAVQSLKALDYAHKNGVIHRDIKPANILVDRELHVHVADFGIAQLVQSDPSESTGDAMVMGTPAYMSPEQKVSMARLDCTTDVYSMGVVLYELLTGDKPQGHFRPPSAYSAEIPESLDEVVYRALAQHPQDRFATAVEFKDAILAALSRAGGSSSTPDSATLVKEASRFLGHCTVLDTIKEHPYGATYLAEDNETHELFVIKKIVKRELGLKEARLLSRLKHPHIVNIFGAGEVDDEAVVLMQYARGGSLSDRLVRRMPWQEVALVLGACLDGLDYAHKNHVLHGNVRPSNILISKDQTPWVSDFGLPEHYGRDGGNWYGAPEGGKSAAADVYALGAVAYQLLTNQLPVYDRQSRLSFPESADLAPADFLSILQRMLERNPEQRYPACGPILEDLKALLKTSQPESRQARDRQSGRPMGWHDWLLGFFSGAAAALLISYLLGWLDPYFIERL